MAYWPLRLSFKDGRTLHDTLRSYYVTVLNNRVKLSYCSLAWSTLLMSSVLAPLMDPQIFNSFTCFDFHGDDLQPFYLVVSCFKIFSFRQRKSSDLTSYIHLLVSKYVIWIIHIRGWYDLLSCEYLTFLNTEVLPTLGVTQNVTKWNVTMETGNLIRNYLPV